MMTRLFLLLCSLAVLAGCATGAQTGSPDNAEQRACTSDEDEFCTETDAQRAAKNHQQGLEAAGAGKNDEALDYFKKAVEYDDTVPEHLYNLSVIHSMLGNVAEEEAALLKAIAIPSEDPKQERVLMSAHYNLACVYAIRGDKDKAFEHLEVVAAFPDSNLQFHLADEDKDLDNLRADPRFKDVLGRIGQPRSEKYPDAADQPASSGH